MKEGRKKAGSIYRVFHPHLQGVTRTGCFTIYRVFHHIQLQGVKVSENEEYRVTK